MQNKSNRGTTQHDRHREAIIDFLSDRDYWMEYTTEELEEVLEYLSIYNLNV